MPRKPRPIPNVAYTQAWLTQLAEERKTPGSKPRATERKTRLEEYESNKKSAHSADSRQTLNTASARKQDGHSARRNAPLWGYHVHIKRLKLGVILLAERGVRYV